MAHPIVNEEMARAWDGAEGEHWTRFTDRYDAVGASLWERFLDADLIGTGDRVLDLGCGTGQSTRDAGRAAASGSVLGVDLSARMLDEARRRTAAEGLTHVTFEQADAQVHPFPSASFDLVISRFGAMFFGDRAAAFGHLAQALRPGGRLALLVWRELAHNAWLRAFRDALLAGRHLPMPPAGAPGIFGLADREPASAMLAAAGFVDVAFTSMEGPMRFGSDAEDAWSFVRHIGIVQGLSADLDDATRATSYDTLRRTLVAHETPTGVELDGAAWLFTATRR